MSVHLEIFIRANTSLDVLAQELGSILSAEMELDVDELDSRYWVLLPAIHLQLLDCRDYFENDGDLNFADYFFYLSIDWSWYQAEELGLKSREQLDTYRDKFAQDLFNRLKALRRWPLMLVYDMGRKLDEFTP